jgi:hypothetical protein
MAILVPVNRNRGILTSLRKSLGTRLNLSSISRVTRQYHALKQYGVRELLFVCNFVQKI